MLPTEIPQTVSKAEGQVPYIPPWAVGQRCCQNKGKNYSKSGVEMHEFKSEASYLPGAAPPTCAGWGSSFPVPNPARGRDKQPLEERRELVDTPVTAVPAGSGVTPARGYEDVPWWPNWPSPHCPQGQGANPQGELWHPGAATSLGHRQHPWHGDRMVPRCHEAEVHLRKERAEESPATTQLGKAL